MAINKEVMGEDEIIGFTPDGLPIYRAEEPEERRIQRFWIDQRTKRMQAPKVVQAPKTSRKRTTFQSHQSSIDDLMSLRMGSGWGRRTK